MKSLIFASNNANKIAEIKTLLPNNFTVVSLAEAGIDIDIEEPYITFQENAAEKARVINELTGGDCFSEDSGLEVTAINGEPGVFSARYAKAEEGFKDNIDKLLSVLKNETNRKAQFKTVICLLMNKNYYYFEGVCSGEIIYEKRGEQGFGYDPVFVPDGSDKTFAEMDMHEKNIFSHRKKAFAKLLQFLNEHHA